MITLKRTDSINEDFRTLVTALDQDLAIRNGDDNAFFAQFNKIAMINHTVVAYSNQKAVGCGAIKQYEPEIMEIKRMYVIPEERGKGIASKILKELEQWTYELGYHECILETGKMQPEAIGLYIKNSYKIIPNYGQYADVESSVCFKKHLHI